MRDVRGRLAFVTAGANGIGLGMARAFAGAGMNIAVVDIDEAALAIAVDELRRTTQAEPYLVNVADRAALAKAADDAEEKFGPVGILCNNAAGGLQQPPEKMTYQAWDLSLSITLGGAVNGTQTFLPRMLGRKEEAHIVNTASQAGLVAGHGGRNYMYTMAKFSVVGLSEALHELLEGTNVGVTALCPGYTATNAANRALANLGSKGLAPADEAKERARLEQMRDNLATYGKPADELGLEVLDAVLKNTLYVQGARRVDQVAARLKAIVDSMPEETDRDRALAAFLNH